VNLPRFFYHRPTTLNQALELLMQLGDNAKVIAGGTDLLVNMKRRLSPPAHLISLSRVKTINQISENSSELVIGAGLLLADLAKSAVIVEKYPAISEAVSLVATQQIRNMGTIGGNIFQNTRCLYYNYSRVFQKTIAPCLKRDGNVCHAVPGSKRCFAVYQGDLGPVLMALRGRAILHSINGVEEIPLEDIFTGDGKTPFSISHNTILAGIRIPISGYRTFARYKKFRQRDGMDFPLPGVAVKIEWNGIGIVGVRICLTGVWSAPVLVRKVEELQVDNLTPPAIKELAETAYNAAHPVPNLEDDPVCRRLMVRVLVEEILTEARRIWKE